MMIERTTRVIITIRTLMLMLLMLNMTKPVHLALGHVPSLAVSVDCPASVQGSPQGCRETKLLDSEKKTERKIQLKLK